jgi:hypothetical protein
VTASPRVRERLLAAALSLPTLGSALGIDGGDMFQIVAVENLALDARTIGIGLGFGVVSVPVQLWAARLQLARARQRLQAFLVADAALCWTLAVIVVVAHPGGALATSALALAVLAEVVLSVLYATAWQPLLSLVLGANGRQQINAQARAVARGLMAGVLLVFGLANETSRVLFLVVLGVGALVLAWVIHGVPVDVSSSAAEATTSIRRRSLPPGMWPLCLTAGLTTASAWPLFVTYTHDVLWPDVNLGLVATAQVTGAVLSGLLWRPTETGLVRRARWAVVAAAGSAAVLAMLRTPVDGSAEGVAVLLMVGAAGAAISTLVMAVMELVHQTVDNDSSVRSLTIFDVVASTSFQAGLLVSGVLVSASVESTWTVDPYRLYLLAGAVSVAAVVLRPGWRRPAGAPGS